MIEIQNEEEQTFDPNFWNDSKAAELVMQSLRSKKKWIEDYNNANVLIEDLEVIYEFYKEGESSIEDVEKRFEQALTCIEDLEFKNMLSEEGDNLSAVLQITAGAGGTESCDWASMLFRMYMMYAEKKTGHQLAADIRSFVLNAD